jgi:hypothetical protein
METTDLYMERAKGTQCLAFPIPTARRGVLLQPLLRLEVVRLLAAFWVDEVSIRLPSVRIC